VSTAVPRRTEAFSAHLFTRKGQAFLVAPATRTSFELDEAGELAARVLLSGKGPDALALDTDERLDLVSALGDLEYLQAQGHFGDFALRIPPLDPLRQYSVAPIISRRCNLRCRYCFSESSSSLEMSPEVMEATARFMATHTARGRTTCQLWLGSVGEITTCLPTYRRFIALLEECGRACGVRFVAGIGTTNLVALDRPEILEQLADLTVGSVSFDGPPLAHDAMRVQPDGRGTYAAAKRGLEAVRARGGDPCVIATLTANYPDVSRVYFHLFRLGFPQVAVKPVRARPDQPYAIGQNLEAICAGYERFAQRLLALPDRQLLKHLLAMTCYGTTDYFARFLVRVREQGIVPYRCGAWVEQLVVDTDGQLYGCQALAGIPEARVGSVWEGVDEARVQEIADLSHVSRREPCRRCWARYLCGGPCAHQSYLSHGSFDRPDPAECHLNRHLVELAVWVCSQLQSRPRVLSALPWVTKGHWHQSATYGCAQSGDDASSYAQAALSGNRPCDVISAESHLNRRLATRSDRFRLEVRLGWNRLGLQLLLRVQGAGETYLRKLSSLHLRLLMPRAMGRASAEGPGLMQELDRQVEADPQRSTVEYLRPPDWRERRPALGARTGADTSSCYVTVPWRACEIPEPRSGQEFGLQLVLRDRAGGEVVWRPREEAARIRLLARGDSMSGGVSDVLPRGADRSLASSYRLAHVRAIAAATPG